MRDAQRYAAATFALMIGASNAAIAQGSADIVVTAQKREQRINSVPMSITAVRGDELLKQGVSQPGDLVKVIPGFNYTVSGYHTPVYVLRGLGYFESSLAADPAVSVYVDQIGLPFSTMTIGAGLDLERVEVLKGPQGIFFGRNSTGGAINYIAAKPTQDFKAGFNAAYRRFGQVDLNGYVSGPLSETLSARIAAKTEQGGTWQKSYTRDDETGNKNLIVGRLLLDWQPTDDLRVELNINGWRDRSDNQAPQLAAIVPKNPSLAVNHPEVLAYPLAPHNARAADWNPGRSLRNRNSLWQVSLRGDYDLSDEITLTSLTSYADYKRYAPMDQDGMIYLNIDTLDEGFIKSFFQEVRVTGNFSSFKPTLGANYSHEDTGENLVSYLRDSASNPLFGVPVNGFAAANTQKINTYAVFGNVEYELIPRLTAQAGVRYAKVDRSFNGCGADDGDGQVALGYQRLQAALKGPGGTVVPIPPGGCATLDANLNPGRLIDNFNQDNLSWRVGLSWQSPSDMLLYANVSQGFKSGGFPTTTAATLAQFRPVTQEKVIAYEAGFKAPLFDRHLQLNGALFYYDYSDKQVRGVISDPVFRTIAALVNIPKSEVSGAELEVQWRPVDGLTIGASALYLHTKVKEYVGANFRGQIVDFKGSRLPYSPKWQGNLNAQYSWPVSDELAGFVGGNMVFHSATNSQLGAYPELILNRYAVLDLNAGIGASDNKWKFSIFGENVTNKYYWNSANNISDVVVRYAAKPAVYGIRLGFEY